MSAYTPIDLSALPAPSVVEPLSFEVIFSAMLADLRARDASFDALLESDPAYKILEVCAYRELIIRQRVNDASRQVMLAYAVGANLDHIGALFGVSRALVSPGNSGAVPPIPPVYESDSELRSRIQLSLEGFSVAGPSGAYVFHALSADSNVLDASAISPAPGEVAVTILSRTGDGAASPSLVAKVSAAVNSNDVRPLTDMVTVQSASIVNFSVTAQIYVYPGPDSSVVLSSANAALSDYIDSVHKIGRDVTISGIYAALHRPGVQRVNLASPAGNITIGATQASYCTAKTITVVTADE
jgi:phage-related baseplate assembly protein